MKQGWNVVRTCKRHFKNSDYNKNNTIDKDEFLIGLKELKIALNNI